MKTLRAMPILQVADVAAAAAFYDRLGFACHGLWGDPPDFAVVQRGDVTVGLFRAGSGAIRPSDQWAAYVYVDDIEALHAELRAEGVDPSPVVDQPYGCRDFDVQDPDGHRIAFGQDVHPHDHGPGLGPERGRG